MSINKLPIECDPVKFAQEGFVFEGQVDTACMDRLQQRIIEKSGLATISLKFDFDEETRVVIDGQLALLVRQSCQRCLQQVDVLVTSTFKLAPVINDTEAKRLPDEYGPVLIEDNRINLFNMLEEEILLSLPLVAKHEGQHNECEYRPRKESTRIIKKPFADLKQMMNGKE